MKAVVAMNAFKGCLSAAAACSAVARGLHKFNPALEVVQIPVSDGGDGLIEALQDTLIRRGFHKLETVVTGPYGKMTPCTLLGKDDCCLIEMAQCSGLALHPVSELRAAKSTSYGLGEAVIFALSHGFKDIKIGLGGSATNDGGAGFAQALGVRFFDRDGEEILRPVCGEDLASLSAVDVSTIDPRVEQAEFTGTCDVSNPLLGPEGATAVFGPQKGAGKEDLELLEQGMQHYSRLLQRESGCNYADTPGSGAAGGMGAALLWFCHASLRQGIEVVLELLEFDAALAGCSVVFTGEGRMDAQSAYGKAPAGVAFRAKQYHLPVLALCGSIAADAQILYASGIDAMFAVCDGPLSLEQSVQQAPELLEKCSCNVIRTFCARRIPDTNPGPET